MNSPPPQQGASEPIRGLTGVHTLSIANLFPSQINIISPMTTTLPPLASSYANYIIYYEFGSKSE